MRTYKIQIIKNHTAIIHKRTRVEARARLIVEQLRAQGIRAYCTELGVGYRASDRLAYTY
jgi:hypothetical protein